MTRTIVISVALLGLVCYFIFRWQAMVTQSQPPILTRVDIYADRIVYKNVGYASPSSLAIALQANRQLPELVEVAECDARARLGDVLDVVRAAGAADFEIVLPDSC